MTMIASAIKDGVPILISDILVSQPQRPLYPFVLPTTMIDVLQFAKDDRKYYPSFFNQKVYVIDERVCIAFAGNLHTIKRALEDVRMFCKICKSVTGEQLGKHLADITKDGDWEEFACIAHVIEVGGSLVRFHYKAKEGISPLFGDVVTSGSGNADFISESLEQGSISLQGVTNPFLKALMMGGTLISKMLCKEWFNLHTINNDWGGGLELVFVNKNRFEKLNNVTYVINYEEFSSEGKLPVPKTILVLHYQYIDEILVITAIRPNNKTIEVSANKYEIKSNNAEVKIFQVSPLDSDKDSITEAAKKMLPSFVSRAVGMGYVFTFEEDIYIPAGFHIGPDIVVSYDEKEGLNITMTKDFHDTITTATEKIFSVD